MVETAPLHPRPAAVANKAGGAVPGAREASPSPQGSLAPSGLRGQGSSTVPSSRSAPDPAESSPTPSALERTPTSGDSGWLYQAALACTLHLLDAFGPSPELYITERLLFADLAGGRGARVDEASRCPENTIQEQIPNTAESPAKCILNLG